MFVALRCLSIAQQCVFPSYARHRCDYCNTMDSGSNHNHHRTYHITNQYMNASTALLVPSHDALLFALLSTIRIQFIRLVPQPL